MLPTWWGIIWILVVVGALIGGVAWKVVEEQRNDDLPRTSFRAQIAKIDTKSSGEYIRSGGTFFWNHDRRYHVTFIQLPDGDKKRISVPVTGKEEFDEQFSVGDIGILTVRGTRYLGFKPEQGSGDVV